jgi:thymidine phosphorylase
MDVPLGLTAGNALEVRESVEVLAGGGPADVVELTLILAREMLDAAGIKSALEPEEALKNGAAMDVWRRMIRAQGGDPDAKLPVAKESHQILAEESGEILEMNALAVGISAWRLGAGRSQQGESVQAGAGIEIHAKPGDSIKAGQPLFTLHTDEPERFERATEALDGAVRISDSGEKTQRLPLILEKITR